MISSLVLVLQVLCLSFWIGGSAALLFITIPRVFALVPDTRQAGAIVSSILGRFRGLLLMVLVTLVLTLWIQLIALTPAIGLQLRSSITLVSLAALFESYDRFAISPRVRRWAIGDGPSGQTEEIQFRRLHRLSKRLFSLNFFIGIAVVITLIVL